MKNKDALIYEPIATRIKTSNWISCLFWFGTDEVGILPIRIGMKEAKASRSISGPAG